MESVSKATRKNETKEAMQEEESALIYLPDGLIEVRLPLINDPAERLIVLRWYVEEGEEVRPDQFIVKIATMYDRIDMPMPPIQGRYRIARINKQPKDILVMGDVFVTLQAINAPDEITSASKPTEASCAA